MITAEINQKYKNLQLSFTLDGIRFEVSSICLECIRKPFPMHSHSNNSYEIHFVPEGCGILSTASGSYTINPGALFVTGPEYEHAQVSVPDNPMLEFCIYMKLPSASDKHIKSSSFLSIFLTRAFWFGTGCPSLREIMSKMLSELSTQPPGHELVLGALLQQYLLEICRLYNDQTDAVCEIRQINSDVNDIPSLVVEEAFLYHYDVITLEGLADMIGLGKRQTERYLKEHYGKSFREKKNEARMSAALTMLKDSNLSVSSIASALGYSTVEHFSNAFRRYFGASPCSVRRDAEVQRCAKSKAEQ